MDVEGLIEMKKRIEEKENTLRRKHQEELNILNAVLKNVSINLAFGCDHEYQRDSYFYAPLYCKHCHLLKEQILNYQSRHKPTDSLQEKVQALMGDI